MRDDGERTLLYNLDSTIQDLAASDPAGQSDCGQMRKSQR
ncbi:hypothetical protein [Govanella unica]